MRRVLTQHARRLATGTSTGSAAFCRPGLTCAQCRSSGARQARSEFHHRSFATSPRYFQKTASSEEPQQQSVPTTPQTHYDFFPSTFPDGIPPKSPFTPDLRQLRKEYLRLQAKAHPDLAPEGQKRHAEATSMRINEAYRTLQDPLKRAQYLLSLHGIDVEDESAKLSGGPLLMEVMEAREAVEEVENEEQLAEVREENTSRIGGSVAVLEEAFGKPDWDAAAQEAVKLRYWMNVEESIRGWEKGKGGGVLHH